MKENNFTKKFYLLINNGDIILSITLITIFITRSDILEYKILAYINLTASIIFLFSSILALITYFIKKTFHTFIHYIYSWVRLIFFFIFIKAGIFLMIFPVIRIVLNDWSVDYLTMIFKFCLGCFIFFFGILNFRISYLLRDTFTEDDSNQKEKKVEIIISNEI